MKLIVFLVFTAVIAKVVYWFNRKDKKRAITLTLLTVLVLTSLQAFVIYKGATAPDKWCTTVHATTSYPPATLKTGMDYFEQGNYDYDTGNCAKAIEDYSQSIKLNPKYAQAYNNRAYTNMRLRNYKDALTDLDKAIALNPNYINALMNRGDIHNYYVIDRKAAIADYEKVIALGGIKETNVCGHLFLAQHDGWNLGTIFGFPVAAVQCMNAR